MKSSPLPPTGQRIYQMNTFEFLMISWMRYTISCKEMVFIVTDSIVNAIAASEVDLEAAIAFISNNKDQFLSGTRTHGDCGLYRTYFAIIPVKMRRLIMEFLFQNH